MCPPEPPSPPAGPQHTAGSGLDEALEREMAEWEEAGLRRRLGEPLAAVAPCDFVSNDYLGLSQHPEVVEGARAALAEAGAGGRAARLLGGGCRLHERAEQKAAEWLGADAALLFPSGYQANLGLLTALAGAGDAIVSDEACHASLIDACRLSRARTLVHGHLDLGHAEQQLRRSAGARRRLLLTEGVFSMDGDSIDLLALAELAVTYDAWLIVDEAHAAGVVGPEGRGTWAAVSATYYAGGRTSLNGVARDDRQSGSRFGATLALPLGGGHSLKLFGSTGLSARTGTDFDTIGVAWQYLWGADP